MSNQATSTVSVTLTGRVIGVVPSANEHEGYWVTLVTRDGDRITKLVANKPQIGTTVRIVVEL